MSHDLSQKKTFLPTDVLQHFSFLLLPHRSYVKKITSQSNQGEFNELIDKLLMRMILTNDDVLIIKTQEKRIMTIIILWRNYEKSLVFLLAINIH